MSFSMKYMQHEMAPSHVLQEYDLHDHGPSQMSWAFLVRPFGAPFDRLCEAIQVCFQRWSYRRKPLRPPQFFEVDLECAADGPCTHVVYVYGEPRPMKGSLIAQLYWPFMNEIERSHFQVHRRLETI